MNYNIALVSLLIKQFWVFISLSFYVVFVVADFSLKEWMLDNEITQESPMSETGSELLVNYMGMSKYLHNSCPHTLSTSGWTGGG